MRIKRNPTYTHIGKKDKTTAEDSTVGVATGGKENFNESRQKATASGMPLRNTSISQLPIEIDIDPLLKDIIFSEDLEQKKLVMRIYKDIYYNDPIGGSSVDLYSTLPFSDINLGGVSDRRASRVFEEAMERLNVQTLMPELSVDLMVTGAFVGSLLPNKSKNILADLIPYQYENCKVDPLPFYSQDPLITVAMPESYKNVLRSDSPRIAKLRDYLGKDVTDQLTADALELDPMTTLYIPRKSFTNSTGISFFRRILPIWLMEKNLFRGTLVETARRQRGILHLTLGDGDQWMPTMNDMQMAMELFQNADADPLGAVIATRMGIDTSEIRSGGDFWKVTDMWDSTMAMKLRALGISESFLSGEANYSNSDTSLTVFMESLRAYRDRITTRMFYNKLFPLISAMNGYTVNSKGKFIQRDPLLDQVSKLHNHSVLDDGSKLLIPSVHWTKQLKPEGDQAYLDMLQALTEKGVPVPLRAIAAAGGFNLNALLADQDDDFELIKRIGEYQEKVGDLKKKYMPKGGGEDDEMGAFASASAEMELRNRARGVRSSVLSQGTTGKMKSLTQRNYGEASEVSGVTHDGKKRWLYDQKLANERVNRRIAKSLSEIAKRGGSPLTEMTRARHIE